MSYFEDKLETILELYGKSYGESSFISAINDAPHDPLPIMVYADWLEENGIPGSDIIRSALNFYQTLESSGLHDINILENPSMDREIEQEIINIANAQQFLRYLMNYLDQDFVKLLWLSEDNEAFESFANILESDFTEYEHDSRYFVLPQHMRYSISNALHALYIAVNNVIETSGIVNEVSRDMMNSSRLEHNILSSIVKLTADIDRLSYVAREAANKYRVASIYAGSPRDPAFDS